MTNQRALDLLQKQSMRRQVGGEVGIFYRSSTNPRIDAYGVAQENAEAVYNELKTQAEALPGPKTINRMRAAGVAVSEAREKEVSRQIGMRGLVDVELDENGRPRKVYRDIVGFVTLQRAMGVQKYFSVDRESGDIDWSKNRRYVWETGEMSPRDYDKFLDETVDGIVALAEAIVSEQGEAERARQPQTREQQIRESGQQLVQQEQARASANVRTNLGGYWIGYDTEVADVALGLLNESERGELNRAKKKKRLTNSYYFEGGVLPQTAEAFYIAYEEAKQIVKERNPQRRGSRWVGVSGTALAVTGVTAAKDTILYVPFVAAKGVFGVGGSLLPFWVTNPVVGAVATGAAVVGGLVVRYRKPIAVKINQYAETYRAWRRGRVATRVDARPQQAESDSPAGDTEALAEKALRALEELQRQN